MSAINNRMGQGPGQLRPSTAWVGRILTCLAVGSLGFGMVACSDDDDPDPIDPDGEGRLIVRMTDAPFPYAWVESADISIDSLSVQIDTSGDPQWMTVNTTSRDINLLTLQNGNTQVLADTDVKTGDILRMRLHVSAASVTLTDDRDFDLTVPSQDVDGIEVAVDDVTVDDDETTELLLDFDVSNSFIPTPNVPNDIDDILMFTFDPQIRVEDLSETGSLSGRVYSNNGTATESDDFVVQGAAVTVLSSTVEIAGTATGFDGTFHVLGLLPGQYEIMVTAHDYIAGSTGATVVKGEDSDDHDVRLSPIEG